MNNSEPPSSLMEVHYFYAVTDATERKRTMLVVFHMPKILEDPPWWLTVVCLAVGVLLIFLSFKGDVTTVKPGPTFNLAEAVEPKLTTENGQLLTVTVNEEEEGSFGLIPCWLDTDCETITKTETAVATLKDEKEQADVNAQQASGEGEVPVVEQYSVNLPGVVGPSAGLATAVVLSGAKTNTKIVDVNKVVAITGTIDMDGNVGSVGGVKLKAVSAKRDGASVFIVPKGQGQEVNVTGLQVVEVTSLAQTWQWLCENAGAVGPECKKDKIKS